MLLNKYKYNNSLKKKNNKEFYKTIKTLIPQTLITSLIYNIQNDINEKEVEYKKISIQDKKEKLKNELTELFDDEEDQEEVEDLIIINKDDDKEDKDKGDDDDEEKGDDDDEEKGDDDDEEKEEDDEENSEEKDNDKEEGDKEEESKEVKKESGDIKKIVVTNFL